MEQERKSQQTAWKEAMTGSKVDVTRDVGALGLASSRDEARDDPRQPAKLTANLFPGGQSSLATTTWDGRSTLTAMGERPLRCLTRGETARQWRWGTQFGETRPIKEDDKEHRVTLANLTMRQISEMGLTLGEVTQAICNTMRPGTREASSHGGIANRCMLLSNSR